MYNQENRFLRYTARQQYITKTSSKIFKFRARVLINHSVRVIQKIQQALSAIFTKAYFYTRTSHLTVRAMEADKLIDELLLGSPPVVLIGGVGEDDLVCS